MGIRRSPGSSPRAITWSSAQPVALPTPDDLVRLLPGCVGWLAGVERITDDVLAAAPDLRVIARNGTGVDAIDLSATRRRGIDVRRAEGECRASRNSRLD